MTSAVRVARDGDALQLHGPLDRAAVPAAWAALRPLLAGARTLDLRGVPSVDSAGLALLAEAAAGGLGIVGEPAGLAELMAAYRLDASLGFGERA